jgi:hypothetical protein
MVSSDVKINTSVQIPKVKSRRDFELMSNPETILAELQK